LLINLKIKFTDHKDIYPAKRPYKENCNGDKLNISELVSNKNIKKCITHKVHMELKEYLLNRGDNNI
jgi:hypothetical protein